MPARLPAAPPALSVRSLQLPPWVRIALAVWVGLAPAAPTWAAPLGTEGRWGAWKDLDAQAVNMILLPGSGGYHSHILFWKGTYADGYDNPLAGGLLRWTEPATNKDYCATGDIDNFSYDYVNEPGFDIFCAGNSALADGRVLVSSGHIAEDIGPVETTVFDPVTQAFQVTPDTMLAGGRWYPTNLSLPKGDALVFGGTSYYNVMNYGGLWDANTTARDPRLQRIYVGSRAEWQARALVAPDPEDGQPETRRGHTLLPNGTDPPILFGGRDSVNKVYNDFWFLRVEQGDIGESYYWEKRLPTGTAPDARSGHIAVLDKDSRMYVFGGVDGDGNVLNDTRRWTPGPNFGVWAAPTVSGSPPARQGHAAIADLVGGRNRMLMFGGVDASGNPVDDAVWRYDFASAAWDSIAITGSRPGGRKGHTMVYVPDPVDTLVGSGVDNMNRVIVYGGKNASSFLNDLWELRIDESDGTLSWNQISSGARTPRAFHSALYDRIWKRMLVIGGETSTGVGSDSAFALAGIAKLTTGPWQTVPHNPDHALYGHKTLEGPLIQNRQVEKFTPWNSAGNRWAKVDSAYRRMGLYPFMFVLPSGNVFHAGPGSGGTDTTTYILDMAANPVDWKSTTFPSRHDGGAAVMYRPGEVLKAGGQHSVLANTISERIRFNASDQALDSPPWGLTGSMYYPRMEHNLTVLPNGQVIVTGGRNANSDADAAYVKRPEIFDPGTLTWTTGNALAPSSAQRGYHSSAILMPDGRIATGGGNYTYGSDSLLVYCPPYLFKPGTDDAATRPRFSTNGAPLSMVTWGRTFTACVEETTGIRGAALLRPGATTHGQDQNQRYVPLTIKGHAGSPKRLFLTAPADSNIAPPGYYMLFLTGSPDRTDVPSIARWVRVGRAHGRDTCDAVRPGKVSELQPDAVGSNSIVMLWYSAGDDGTLAPSGAAVKYHMRRSSAAISDDTAWSSATPVTTLDPIPLPAEAGTPQSTEVTGLSSCTYYHFALRAEDDNYSSSAPGNPLADFHDDVLVQTTCGGGGGYAAERVVGTAGAARVGASGIGPSRGPAETYALQPGPGILIIEPMRDGATGWQVKFRYAREADLLDPKDSGELLVQMRTVSGQWVTRARMAPGEADQKLGICSLRENARVVVPADYALDQVVPTLRLGDRSYTLAGAVHSRLGTLEAAFVSDGGRVQMAASDSLQLAYQPVETVPEGTASWYLLVGRTGSASPASNRRELPSALPASFALHPNQPNPFRGVTVIPFDLPIPRTVRLEVFDLLGRRVATLADGPYRAGSHTVEWDLRDMNGTIARPGVYVYRMMAGDFGARGKMTVLP